MLNSGAGTLQYEGPAASLADMPGLIRDAHKGKGLGRTFLRHLKRARIIVHVVDGSGENPGDDYRVVREELRMFNPKYVQVGADGCCC